MVIRKARCGGGISRSICAWTGSCDVRLACSSTTESRPMRDAKLLDQVRHATRLPHCRVRTEPSNARGFYRFVMHYGKRHLREVGSARGGRVPYADAALFLRLTSGMSAEANVENALDTQLLRHFAGQQQQHARRLAQPARDADGPAVGSAGSRRTTRGVPGG